MPCMYALHVCLTCMPYMHAETSNPPRPPASGTHLPPRPPACMRADTGKGLGMRVVAFRKNVEERDASVDVVTVDVVTPSLPLVLQSRFGV